MMELAFSESAGGALKCAKSEKHADNISNNVEILTLSLDIGDISDVNSAMHKRKTVLQKLFEDFPGVPEIIWKTNQKTLDKLLEMKATLEPVRIWICSNNPAELCGFYFVCHLMADSRVPLSVVRIPAQIQKDNNIINYHSPGEIDPQEIGAIAGCNETVSELERKVYTNIWKEQMSENAPLRAVVNGNLIGVPEDFYDFALRTNMPKGEFMVAHLIGRTMCQISGVGDRWLFLRIQAMLQSGELIRISDATEDHPYSGVVRSSKESSK